MGRASAKTAYARFCLRLESAWSQAGAARAPQPRCDDEGCAAGLAPRALLFAARSPMRERKIAQIPQENTCRSHQSASAWRRIWPPNRPSAAGLPV